MSAIADTQDEETENHEELSDSVPAVFHVGERLRMAREDQKFDLAHIAAETRIPIRHLETIETGRFEDLPSRTYATGFARSYARMVGLDEKTIADEIREELGASQTYETAIVGGMEPGDPAKLPSAGLALAGTVAALLLAIGVFVFAGTFFGAGDPLPALATESAAEEASTADGAQAAANSASADEEGAAGAASSGEQVVITAREEVWVRLFEQGGNRLSEAVLKAGDTLEVPLDAVDPRINTGRPDVLDITIGGRAVPKLAETRIPLGDAPVSAAALLARSAD